METTNEAPWSEAFEITGAGNDEIVLRQVNEKVFALGSGAGSPDDEASGQPTPEVTIRYRPNKPTGLEKYLGRDEQVTPEVLEQIRTVDSIVLPTTDLASVPGPMRWFTNSYGVHTPAALIHDWLIPSKGDPPPPIREEYADRYFRYMLAAVGVPRFKRYIMWGAVAIRTRWESPKWWRPPLLVVWGVLASAGLAAFVIALWSLIGDTWTPFGIDAALLLVLSLLAPLVFSLLWGRQYGAGIVAALAAPWVIPAAFFAAFGYGVYYVLEWLGDLLLSRWWSEPADLDGPE